jgi:hypothetical protein
MEILAFWAGVIAVWLYFRLTTMAQRRRWVWDFWAAVFALGGTGALWTLLR